jgi:hypothetical protein
MILDLSLTNEHLYAGLDVQRDAGKLNLRTPIGTATAVMGENLQQMDIDPEEVVLTGPMAIWAYLVVFHSIHGRTKRIYYQDGVGNRILVAAHGG